MQVKQQHTTISAAPLLYTRQHELNKHKYNILTDPQLKRTKNVCNKTG